MIPVITAEKQHLFQHKMKPLALKGTVVCTFLKEKQQCITFKIRDALDWESILVL